jgi:hypothetical protein
LVVDRTEIEEQYMEFLDDEIGIASGADSEESRFLVDDAGKADWCLRKLRQVRQRMDKRQAFVEAEIERLQAWQRKQDEPDVRAVSYFEYQLRNYFEQLREAGVLGKRKNYRLPNGTLAARKAAAKLERDEAQLLAWVKENAPEQVVVTEKVAWGGLKPRVELVELADGWAAVDRATGEMIPGITVAVPEGETFSVTVEGVGST